MFFVFLNSLQKGNVAGRRKKQGLNHRRFHKPGLWARSTSWVVGWVFPACIISSTDSWGQVGAVRIVYDTKVRTGSGMIWYDSMVMLGKIRCQQHDLSRLARRVELLLLRLQVPVSLCHVGFCGRNPDKQDSQIAACETARFEKGEKTTHARILFNLSFSFVSFV